ncbi:DUF4388 domain-containing protein, partial [Myxococcota bacterium]|nr:DUF4388 domain-containing protein [Myxococcota bacterium]
MPELLAGSLKAVGLPSLLQLAESEGLSGRLTLHGAGEVDLREGQPVGARCEGLWARAALMELFLVDADRFSLDGAGSLPAGPPLGEVIELVMEGCRLADEWSRLAACPVARAPQAPVPGPVGALLAGEAAQDGDGGRDERHRPADPDGSREHVDGDERGVHPARASGTSRSR